ncbi:MAG: MORN motif precursor, partial [SAR324 cluster bacterium]|nr:MORN motif precursor [SAR324 cluster bacterium]MEE3266329.1 MORN motif precursor [SAR324 cluster bacterium]
MKHLLITILFLLLFTTPQFGQPKETGVLYIWENGSSYKGEWKYGKMHGQGKFT